VDCGKARGTRRQEIPHGVGGEIWGHPCFFWPGGSGGDHGKSCYYMFIVFS